MNDSKQSLKRRGLLGGAATLGVLATAAATLPLQDPATAPPDTAAAPGSTDKTAGGYQLTAHVQHYYKTARI